MPAISAPRIGDRPTPRWPGWRRSRPAGRPRGTARGSWSAPPARTGAAAAKRPTNSIAERRRRRRAAIVPSSGPTPAVAAGRRARRAAKMIGTSARSSNSSMREAPARPTGALRADQRQHHRGRGQGQREAERRSSRRSGWPIRCRPTADDHRAAEQLGRADAEHRAAASTTSAGSDSSRPIENSSRTMPSSAKGSIACGLRDGDIVKPGMRARERAEPGRADQHADQDEADDRA